MTTAEFLNNTDFTLNGGGYLDIIRNRVPYWLATAGGITALNALDAAIVAERNNVHTLTSDGITDSAVVSVSAGADDGGKLRWIAKELIDCIEASVPFATGVEVDQTIQWKVTATGAPLANLSAPKKTDPKLFKSFVYLPTMTTYGYTATTRTTRAATIAAAYAFYAAVSAL